MGLLVSDDSFRELPLSYQRILEVACGETAIDRLAIYDVEEPRALRRLIENHGVMLRRYPDDVLDAAWRESNAYLKDQSSRNADFARVYASWDAFRTSAFGYARGNELSYRRDAFPRVG